ncbi:kinase-like protein [Xylariaceae sp. FL1019]|nr:kinase-like protein [Xylariaceae sp. FL1019]
MGDAKPRPKGAKELADKIRANMRKSRERGEAEAKGLKIEESGPQLPRVEDDGTIILHEFGSRTVSMSPDGIITKQGSGISLGEIEALNVARQAGVPCPIPYGGQKLDGNRTAIQMSCVQGQSLDKVWGSMSPGEKSSIARQLRDIIDKMRALGPPPDLVGGCGHTPFRHLRAYDFAESASFTNEAALNDWLLSSMYKLVPSPIRQAFRLTLRADHRIVFAHGDLGQRNIMVQDGKITGLIDWECAGWFPEYWEYVLFHKQIHDDRDWREHSPTVFSQPYHEELVQYWALSQFIN